MTAPRISVVVSAYDRADLLPGLVAALQAQTLDDFEAILVDNGSRDGTGDVLRRLAADDPRFRVLAVEDNRGPARARNLGWRAATAPLVAFTDDDCEPQPGWLAALVAAAADADVVQGRTVPAVALNDRPGWFDRSQTIDAWTGRFETCNLLLPRPILADLDGFTEQFRIAMGEDTDLGLRAVAAGATTAFCGAAVVRHHVWPSGFRSFLEQRRRYAEHVELVRLQPGARDLLRWRLVVRDVHLVVWGLVPVTAAAVAAGAPWVPAVVVATWAGANTWRTRRRPFSAPRRFGYSLLSFAAYAYEAACFARASVRYRALVI